MQSCCLDGRLHHTALCVSPPQVVDIMRVNVDKVLERDQKLSELDDRADALQAGASQFETSAAKLKNKYWWKNAKVRSCRHPYLNSKCLSVYRQNEKKRKNKNQSETESLCKQGANYNHQFLL